MASQKYIAIFLTLVYLQLANSQSADPQCNPNPCANGGTCFPETGSRFQCRCAPGFIGDTCDEEMDCNSNPCEHGGTCETFDDGQLVYDFCICPSRYSGEFCEIDCNVRISEQCGRGCGIGKRRVRSVCGSNHYDKLEDCCIKPCAPGGSGNFRGNKCSDFPPFGGSP